MNWTHCAQDARKLLMWGVGNGGKNACMRHVLVCCMLQWWGEWLTLSSLMSNLTHPKPFDQCNHTPMGHLVDWLCRHLHTVLLSPCLCRQVPVHVWWTSYSRRWMAWRAENRSSWWALPTDQVSRCTLTFDLWSYTTVSWFCMTLQVYSTCVLSKPLASVTYST